MNEQPWRKAVCKCGHETAWRHEYSGGQLWVVFKGGDTCQKCKLQFTEYTVKFTQELQEVEK